MKISELQARQGDIDLVADAINKEEPRSVSTRTGSQARVCNVTLKDETGEVKLSLWNEDVDKVNVGDKVHIEKGYCSEWQGEKQLSAGKFGKIEVVGKSETAPAEEAPAEEVSPEKSEEPVEEETVE